MNWDDRDEHEDYEDDDDMQEAGGGFLRMLIIVALFAGGGFGLFKYLSQDEQGPVVFNIEDQVAELGQLLDDKSCANAKVLFDKLLKMELNPLEKRQVLRREKGLKKCLARAAAQAAQSEMKDPVISEALAKSLIFVNLQKKHFSKPQPIMDMVTLTLEDARVIKGEDGELTVGIQVTIRPRKTMLYDEKAFSLFDNNDALEQARWFRPVPAEQETVFQPRLGSGQMERGRPMTAWITFGGLDSKVKHLGLQYRPVWAGSQPHVVGISPNMRLKAP